LCALASVILSLAATAILRSQRHAIARVDSQRTAIAGQHVAEGLLQRSIAMLRIDPLAQGTVVDPANLWPNASCQLQRLSPTATRIQIFLYSGSTTPAIDTVVDPTAL
jgi:hypothetical protein